MVAQNIANYLKDNGIKGTWLAKKLNIPKQTLYTILKGRAELKADMYIQICQILRVNPDIFTDKEE